MVAFAPQQPLFPLGQVVATPGALEVLTQAGQSPAEFLTRHSKGDWGELSEEDRRLNDESVRDGSRILSAYRTKSDVRIWIITEASDDHGRRESTSLLLPEEY